MPDRELRLPISRFVISDYQIEELIFELNKAFEKRRREISIKRNVDPFSGYPVMKESFWLSVPGIENDHGSIYVENIRVGREIIRVEINVAITAVSSLLKSHHLIEPLAKLQDEERALERKPRLANLTGKIRGVQWGDQLVAWTLADAYKAITGLAPTMGGYKKPKFDGEDFPPSAPAIRSPFAVFAMKLIEMGDIKRLGAGEFTVGILRDAMSGNWRHNDTGRSRLYRPVLAKIADAQAAGEPGRPPLGQEQWRLRTPKPIEMDECTSEEAGSMTLEEFEVDEGE